MANSDQTNSKSLKFQIIEKPHSKSLNKKEFVTLEFNLNFTFGLFILLFSNDNIL